MVNEQSTPGVAVAVSPPNTSGRFDNEDICALYLNILTHGWLDPEAMPIRMAEHYGRKLGTYGRLALLEKERANAHRTVVDDAFATLRGSER